MAFIKAIAECFGLMAEETRIHPVDEKRGVQLQTNSPRNKDLQSKSVASNVVTHLLNAEIVGPNLKKTLDETVGQFGWTEKIANAVWQKLIDALNGTANFGAAFSDATKRALEAAGEFASDHPQFIALIALGVLVIMAPWVLEALGFGASGPIEGEYNQSFCLVLSNERPRPIFGCLSFELTYQGPWLLRGNLAMLVSCPRGLCFPFFSDLV